MPKPCKTAVKDLLIIEVLVVEADEMPKAEVPETADIDSCP